MTSEVLARWGLRASDAEAARAWTGPGDAVMRVVAEFRGGYLVQGEAGELKAGASGRLRRAIKVDGADKPAVGDWVMTTARAEEGSAQIHGVLPRRTCMLRRAAGRDAVPQVVAANVDVVLVVTAIVGDFNVRRLERYLAAVQGSGARAVLALSKVDLALPEEAEARLAEARALAGDAVSVHVISTVSGAGLDALDEDVWARGAGGEEPTVALVGSSGVGKSTLINRWLGDAGRIATKELGSDGRGQHTTSHRELFLRPAGGLVMDTPGMRELGLWAAEEGLDDTFDDVSAVAAGCRFRDCRHAREPGCAVVAAVEAGTLSAERVEAWRKLAGELAETGKDAMLARKRAEKALTRAIEKITRAKDDD